MFYLILCYIFLLLQGIRILYDWLAIYHFHQYIVKPPSQLLLLIIFYWVLWINLKILFCFNVASNHLARLSISRKKGHIDPKKSIRNYYMNMSHLKKRFSIKSENPEREKSNFCMRGGGKGGLNIKITLQMMMMKVICDVDANFRQKGQLIKWSSERRTA